MKVSKRPGVVGLIVVGAFVAAMGLFSLALPYVAGTAVAILAGAALVIAGVGEIVQSFSHSRVSRKLGSFVLGAITAAAGAIGLADPWLELEVLTFLLSMALVVSGVWRIVAAWSFRETGGWIGLAMSGLVGIVLGAMIWIGWPASSYWAIGALVGVDLLFTGVSLVALGLSLGKVVSGADRTAGEVAAPSTTAP
ncbi:MAG TPA: DUF308 domain-containing protein [Pirellulaceae bacterium]|jgi:uncharacterized membrane protein HdeD (DUF308 family)|nr:DUF308 domain-containing protein [Pirellulaceae bacterium]